MKEKYSADNTLRKFGFIFSGYFILITLLLLQIHNDNILANNRWIFLPLFIFCFLVCPKILLPLKITWDYILKILGWINTRIILGIIFFLLFTPIAFLRRITRRHIVDINCDKNAATYRAIVTDNNDLRRPY